MYEFEQRIQIALEEIDFMIEQSDKQLQELKKTQLKPGKMELKPHGRRFYYYLIPEDAANPHVRIYLGTPASPEVRIRKEIRFLEERLKVLRHDKKVLERTRKQFRSFAPEDIHRKLPSAYKDLPNSCYTDPRCVELQEWAKEAYPRNKWPYPINATRDCNGNVTRSKGECIWIDNATFAGLDFQYDGKYRLMTSDGEFVDVNPDITVMTRRGRYVFVEHLGKLLDEVYAERFKRNVQKYMRCGYVPGENLLFTSDNADNQTNSLAICQMIELIKIKVREG